MKYLSGQEAFAKIIEAIDLLADAVKPTYGPKAGKMLINKPSHGYMMVVDDGVQIARDLQTYDDVINAILKVVKEVAIKTNDRVGDGTTSAILIAYALMHEIEKREEINGREIGIELKKALEEAKEQLIGMATEITTVEDLKRVAKVSYDNDEMATIIAEMIHKVGKDGVVTVATSGTMETVHEVIDGLEVKAGYLSPYMVTDFVRGEAVLENAWVLVTDYRVTEDKDILPILEKVVKSGNNNLVIFAEGFEGNALATITMNHVNMMNPQTNQPGALKTLVVAVPRNDRKQWLQDIALITGANVLDADKGSRLFNAELTDLGKAPKVIGRKEATIITSGADKMELEVEIASIRESLKTAPDHLRPQIEQRLARLTNGIGVIKVGAATDQETKALKYKVEDAVNATRVAYRDGIVPGAGRALSEVKTSSELLNKALKYPTTQLELNGVDYSNLGDEIVDPVSVAVAGIESAISIATLLSQTTGIMTEEPTLDERMKNGYSL